MKDLVAGLKINNLTYIERSERPPNHKPNRKVYDYFCVIVARLKL